MSARFCPLCGNRVHRGACNQATGIDRFYNWLGDSDFIYHITSFPYSLVLLLGCMVLFGAILVGIFALCGGDLTCR